jgi:hypothetical protein
VGDGQPARVADRLDLPRDPGGALLLDVRAPESTEGPGQPPRGIDLEVLAVAEHTGPGVAHLDPGAHRPVRGDPVAELEFAPDLGIGDRLPETLRGRADVDLEHLFHLVLRSVS